MQRPIDGLRIFISHSRQDSHWCPAFVEGLSLAGGDVWYDETGIQGGATWIDTIAHELESREIFLVILTPESWNSPWVQREIQLALASHREIVPVLLSATPLSGFMRIIQWIDVTDMDGSTAAAIVAQHLAHKMGGTNTK